jgi:hypothetical protein
MPFRWLWVASCVLAISLGGAVARADGGEIGQVKTVAGDAYLVHDGARAVAVPGAAVFESDCPSSYNLEQSTA